MNKIKRIGTLGPGTQTEEKTVALIQAGRILTIISDQTSFSRHHIALNYPAFIEDICPENSILLDDGTTGQISYDSKNYR